MVTSALTERCAAIASPCEAGPLPPAPHPPLPQTRALFMCAAPYLGDTVLPPEKQALPALLAVWFVNFRQDLEKSCV